MARRPRIDLPGYYHIVNRGVGQRNVFEEDEDYLKFLDILSHESRAYGVIVHNYCLMGNHYHLLIETKKPNLSRFMRQINANYAIYFNKKYNRTGHLWQGRFKSFIVTDEAYLYTLIRYIEQNPVEAKIVRKCGEYPYASSYYFLNDIPMPKWLKKSWLIKLYRGDKNAMNEFLQTPPDRDDLKLLKKAASTIDAPLEDEGPKDERLKELLENLEDKKERNRRIVEAYREGFSQHKIAKFLGLNQATVQRIIKRTAK